jgi:hypothetical protein
MGRLADAERFEEAASARDRLRALAGALHRSRQDAWLVGAGRLEVLAEGERRLAFVGGSLSRAGDADVEPIPIPCPRERADELAAVRSWLRRNLVRLVACESPLAEPVDGGARIARILRWSRPPRAREAGTG